MLVLFLLIKDVSPRHDYEKPHPGGSQKGDMYTPKLGTTNSNIPNKVPVWAGVRAWGQRLITYLEERRETQERGRVF